MNPTARLALFALAAAASVFALDACSKNSGSSQVRPAATSAPRPKPQPLKRVGIKGVLPITIVKSSYPPPATPVVVAAKSRPVKVAAKVPPRSRQKIASSSMDAQEGEDFYLWFCVETGPQINGVEISGVSGFLDPAQAGDKFRPVSPLTSGDLQSGGDYFTGFQTISVPPCSGEARGFVHIKIPADYLQNHMFDPDGPQGELDPVALDLIAIYVFKQGSGENTGHYERILINVMSAKKARRR
jgi:hypothetical protein